MQTVLFQIFWGKRNVCQPITYLSVSGQGKPPSPANAPRRSAARAVTEASSLLPAPPHRWSQGLLFTQGQGSRALEVQRTGKPGDARGTLTLVSPTQAVPRVLQPVSVALVPVTSLLLSGHLCSEGLSWNSHLSLVLMTSQRAVRVLLLGGEALHGPQTSKFAYLLGIPLPLDHPLSAFHSRDCIAQAGVLFFLLWNLFLLSLALGIL